MIEDKKIENLFRDNQHKLDEMPSPMAWDRLEGRLNERDTRHKGFTWQRLAVAAAVFIAVSMLGMWTLVDPLGSEMNKTTALLAERQLASEIIASDAPAPARPILMSHREKSQYLTEVSKTRINARPALAERLPIKTMNAPPPKVIPQTKQFVPTSQAESTPSITSTNMMVQEDIQPVTKEDIIEIQAKKEMEIAELKASSDDSFVKDKQIEMAENQSVVTVPSNISTTSADYADAVYDIVAEEKTEEIFDEGISLDEIMVRKESKAKRSDKKRRKAKTQNKKEIVETRAVTPPSPAAIIIAEAEMEAEPGLNHFDWLLGKWVDEDDNSFEEWQRTNANTLEGKGYFVVNVDTTFTQSMKIVQANQTVYFMVNRQLVEERFELEEYDDRSATFKNENETKEQIILKKDKNNSYSITIEKNKKETVRERKKKKRIFRRVKE